jgi:hypothetical protein
MQPTLIDRIKEKFKQLDPNASYTSTLTMIGSLIAENGINYIYASIAIYTAWYSSKVNKAKLNKEIEALELNNKKIALDIDLHKQERELALEEKRIAIKEKNLKLDEYGKNIE